MSVNIIEQMDSVIADAQTLLNELADDALAQEYVNAVLNSALFIRDEMNLYLNPDGSANEKVIVLGSYTRTTFSLIEAHAYIAKWQNTQGTITLSSLQLEQLESIVNKVNAVRRYLDEIWKIAE